MCISSNPSAVPGQSNNLAMPRPSVSSDPMDFSNKYNTKLRPEEEVKFQYWAEKNGKAKDTYDYDIRGAWKDMQSGKMKADDRGHLGDKYKKPNHPTFSDQSVYHGKDGNKGGRWTREGDKDVYEASPTNMWDEETLKEYFNKNEKGVVLKRGK